MPPSRPQQKNAALTSLNHQPSKIITGQSSRMTHLFTIIDKVADTEADILLLGENGTGKEVIARTIHQRSNRANEIFTTVDMGAVTETLFESELFGHKKGAFTDAREDRISRFEMANGGTLFLDEIGNLSLALQAKLLTVLQRREITRVGTNKAIPIDVRLICATNMPLYKMVQEQKFRQDLLYRINTVELPLPALRDRSEDIPALVTHFLEVYGQKYKRPLKSISPEALKKLQRYNWPGNIRELQHVIERATIISANNRLQAEDFYFLDEPVETSRREEPDTLNLDEMEKETVRRAMQKFNGNISKVAKELGLSRASLYRRLEKYEL